VILPKPPSGEEKYLYIDQNKGLIYTFGVISFICLICGMLLFSFTHENTVFYLAFTGLVFFYLGVSYYIGLFGNSFDVWDHNSIRDEHSRFRPSVDVYLPSCGEPIEVLVNTFKAVRALDWPEYLLNVYVLDDSGRDEVKRWADHYEFNYLSRPNRGELKKAGNIRYAFKETSGEFFLILDADFCPRHDMIKELIGYFEHDEKIAIVQSPQFFSVDSPMTWIEKGSAYIQELFYRLVQVNRNSWDASICVGTCAIYRRSSLEKHGGTYAIAYSEDMHTGWQVTHDGWKVRYVPIILSKGMCPDTMRAFFVQQLRWCTGSTSLLFSSKFWKSRLSVMQKICYLSGMSYYVVTALSIFLTPMPAIIMTWFYPDKVFWYNYLFSVPSFIFGVVILAIWGRLRFGFYVLTARQVSFYAHLFALYDKFLGSAVQWVPTGDSKEMKKVGRYQDFKQLMFFWTFITTAVSYAGAFYHMDTLGDINFYPLIFFSTLNYFVSMSALKDEA
jgi:cellulose synthase/poly-beta-1,6-N-acetylglucosamine synthase-like glycosyltransferase